MAGAGRPGREEIRLGVDSTLVAHHQRAGRSLSQRVRSVQGMNIKELEERALDALSGVALTIPVAQEVDEAAWLEQRLKGLGGSDAGTVLGLNPYQGAFELWLLKTGQIQAPDLTGNEPIYWGHRLEAMVCEEFSRRHGGPPLYKPGFMAQSVDRPWQQVSLDAVTMDPDTGELAIFEAKTASGFLANEWEDDRIPARYEAQCYHAAAVTGIRNVWIGCLIGGQRFVAKKVQIDEAVLSDVVAAEERFWVDHVIGGAQPQPDASASCTDVLRDMWVAQAGTIELPPEAFDVADAYLECNARIDELETEKKRLGNWLRNEMGEMTTGSVGGVVVATNKEQKRKHFNLAGFRADHGDSTPYEEERTTRVLRVAQRKEQG